MNRFTDSAKQSLGGSPIIQSRTKMSTENVIKNYPQGVSITEFDLIVKGDGTSYPVLAFAENPNAYFNGGALAAKVVDGWIKDFDGDIEGASAELKAAGGVKFRMYTTRTKTGKTMTAFEPVE